MSLLRSLLSCFERQNLLVAWRSLNWLAVQWAPGLSPYCCCPSTRNRDVHHHSSTPILQLLLYLSHLFFYNGPWPCRWDPESYFYKCVDTMDWIWWIWEVSPTRGLVNSEWVKPLRWPDYNGSDVLSAFIHSWVQDLWQFWEGVETFTARALMVEIGFLWVVCPWPLSCSLSWFWPPWNEQPLKLSTKCILAFKAKFILAFKVFLVSVTATKTNWLTGWLTN